jgi:hypothetical protein
MVTLTRPFVTSPTFLAQGLNASRHKGCFGEYITLNLILTAQAIEGITTANRNKTTIKTENNFFILSFLLSFNKLFDQSSTLRLPSARANSQKRIQRKLSEGTNNKFISPLKPCFEKNSVMHFLFVKGAGILGEKD